jgi:hypothetical protein
MSRWFESPGSLMDTVGEGVRREDSSKSAPVGIRTPNLLIRSQMLYPLSYGRSRYRNNAGGSLARALLVKARGCTAVPSGA